MKNRFRRFQPQHTLLALLLANLILGSLIGDQYGQTWDEPSFYLYGERSFDAYMRGLAGQPLIPEKHIFFLDLRYYGPFHTAVGWKIVQLLSPILKHWGQMDLWHFVNFVSFQLALLSLYFLAKRFVRPWTAFFVVLLFSSQPLLFGHAFINPKDIPFMTFFLASVAAGLYMSDAIARDSDQRDERELNPFFSFSLPLALLFGLFVFTYTGKDLFQWVVARAVTPMYFAPPDSILGQIFSILAGSSNRLPVENYIHKAYAMHLERIVLALLFIIVVGRKLYLDYSINRKWRLDAGVDARYWGAILIAGIILGLATSIRLLAPFAGLLVTVYSISTRGRASLPPLIVYFSIASVVCVSTWPFLWDSPSFHFLEALRVMRDFPFNAEVRFMGDNIAPSNLPWYFIPFLVTVQLTEPAVLLAWVGLFIVLYKFRNSALTAVSILLAWIVVPLGLQILLKSNVYDNFRQFLFVLPPMFVLAGMGFEALEIRLKTPASKLVLMGICILPGLVGIVSLHPIQYIYYNSFVGGVAGAEGDFELDYWLTAYREAGSYINEHASPNANILAWGSGYNGAREDLDVYSFASEADLTGSSLTFEYAVISTRFFSHQAIFKDAPVVYEVRRDGALLAVVKKLEK